MHQSFKNRLDTVSHDLPIGPAQILNSHENQGHCINSITYWIFEVAQAAAASRVRIITLILTHVLNWTAGLIYDE